MRMSQIVDSNAFHSRFFRPSCHFMVQKAFCQMKDTVFHLTKSFLHHEMTRGAEKAGVKRIRIHDLRHSHVSLLISMGFSAVSIGNRVGHESVDITYRYAHMFPTEQTQMAKLLNEEFKEGAEE